MNEIDEKKLARMIDDSVKKYMDNNVYKQTRKDIKNHVDTILQGELLHKLVKNVDNIVQTLYEGKLDSWLLGLIRKHFPPNIIYVHENRKAPPQLLPFSVKECFVAPVVPCVYFLCKDDRIVYIGQSVNLTSRLGHHLITKNFDRIYFMDVPETDLNRIEKELIEYYDPEYNQTGKNATRLETRNERQRK